MIELVGLVEPYKSNSMNKIELWNEFFVTGVLYFMISFTNPALDATARHQMGIGCVIFTGLILFVNFGNLTVQSYFGLL